MNFDKLLTELSDLYTGIKSGKIEVPKAHELNNTALNIQGTIRLALLNAKLRNEAPSLTFFGKAAPPRKRPQTTK